jgi:hypothetical protein
MLHGYGQTPEDLGAAIIFINNWMNNPGASRLPKAILVYVDGRCRVTTARPSASAARQRGGTREVVARADGLDTNYRRCRCRTADDGKAECIRGNFFTDSARDGGMMAESWWLELMDEIDTRYRTMAPTEVTWQE